MFCSPDLYGGDYVTISGCDAVQSDKNSYHRFISQETDIEFHTANMAISTQDLIIFKITCNCVAVQMNDIV